MSDAPLMFFELLKTNLEAIGFQQYKHVDPCLFVRKKAICLIYVDDCLWFGVDGAALDVLIDGMCQCLHIMCLPIGECQV